MQHDLARRQQFNVDVDDLVVFGKGMQQRQRTVAVGALYGGLRPGRRQQRAIDQRFGLVRAIQVEPHHRRGGIGHAGPFGRRNQVAQQADVVDGGVGLHEGSTQEERGLVAETTRHCVAPQAVAALAAKCHLRQHLGRTRAVGARPLLHRAVREQAIGHHQAHALGQHALFQPPSQHVHTAERHVRTPDRMRAHTAVFRHVERHGKQPRLISDAVNQKTGDGRGGDGHGDLPAARGGKRRPYLHQRPSTPNV